VAAAFEQARALGIPEGEFLEDAVFDFLVTGDARVLEDTKDFAEFVLAREGGGTIQLGTLNGNLWNDLNGNGVQDGGETPLPGWTLYLDSVENGQLDQGELFTTTDANGAYSFTDLGAGTFVVGQVLQAGWEQTSPGASTSQTVDVASGATVENVNFGNVQPNVMEGTSRRNTLIGTEGRDIITGLRGRDTLTTGGGNDDLVYTALADAGDRITDFEVGRDRIVVSPLLESLNYQGTNAIADQYIQFQARGSDTLVQIDPDGLGSARARALVLVEDVTVAALNDTGNFVF
jgi:Ca2+-binding RTX toxin-like protein